MLKTNILTISLASLIITAVGFMNAPMVKAVPAETMANLRTVASPSYQAPTDENTLFNNISSIIKLVLELLGFIFVILMIYAGILWMTAGGNEKQVEKAKNIISRAAIGLVIVVSAYAVTYFIFTNLPGGGGAGPA
jgi:hypothetical protein